MPFDRAWLENERLGLLIEQARLAGMLSVIEQMIAQLDGADSSPALTLDALQTLLPDGDRIEGGIEPHEHPIHS